MTDDPEPFLCTWTIYDSPSDAPGLFVVRRFMILAGSEPVPDPEPYAVSVSLSAARRSIPAGCARFHRSPEDDENIVETWM